MYGEVSREMINVIIVMNKSPSNTGQEVITIREMINMFNAINRSPFNTEAKT